LNRSKQRERRKEESFSVLVGLLCLEVEFVEEAMEDRGKDDTHAGDESKAAEKSVTTSEEFPGTGLEGSHRSHAGENHRGVQEGIEPGQIFEEMVARHAATEGTQDDGTSDGGATPKAGVKDAAWQQGLFAVLEHFLARLWRRSRPRSADWQNLKKPGLPSARVQLYSPACVRMTRRELL
jgi:hypothetical protein